MSDVQCTYWRGNRRRHRNYAGVDCSIVPRRLGEAHKALRRALGSMWLTTVKKYHQYHALQTTVSPQTVSSDGSSAPSRKTRLILCKDINNRTTVRKGQSNVRTGAHVCSEVLPEISLI